MAAAPNLPKVTAPTTAALLPVQSPRTPYPIIISISVVTIVTLAIFIVTHWRNHKHVVYQGGSDYVDMDRDGEDGKTTFEMDGLSHAVHRGSGSLQISSTQNAAVKDTSGQNTAFASRGFDAYSSQPSRSTTKQYTSTQRIFKDWGSHEHHSFPGSQPDSADDMVYDEQSGTWELARQYSGIDAVKSLDERYRNPLHILPPPLNSHLKARDPEVVPNPITSPFQDESRRFSLVQYSQDPTLLRYGTQRHVSRPPRAIADTDNATYRAYHPDLAESMATSEESGYNQSRESSMVQSRFNSEFGGSVMEASAVGTELSEDQESSLRRPARRYRQLG